MGSVGATLLSVALLITPAAAVGTPHCTVCTKDLGTAVIVSACQPVGVDGCACPLANPTTNNCHFIP